MSNYKKLGIDSANLPFKVSFLSPDGQVLGTLFKGLNEKITQEDLDILSLGLYIIPDSSIGKVIKENTSITCETLTITTPEQLAALKWSTIISGAERGQIPISCIGAEKTITIVGETYNVVLIGVNHDDLLGGGKANTTWQLKNCYNTIYPMNSTNTNKGGYESSEMHTTHLPSIFNQIQLDVKNAIKSVIKKTSKGNKSNIIVDTNCNLFLLSEIEIFGETHYSASGEGTQYIYWSQHDNNKDRRKEFQNNSAYQSWLERSPYVPNSNNFCYVYAAGYESFGSANSSKGISFAFCI